MEGEGICRTCLKTTDKLMPLFQTPLLVFKIVAIAPVEIFSKDHLPQTICEECCQNIDNFFNFKEMIMNNDNILKRRYIETSAEVFNENVNNKHIESTTEVFKENINNKHIESTAEVFNENVNDNFVEPIDIKREILEETIRIQDEHNIDRKSNIYNVFEWNGNTTVSNNCDYLDLVPKNKEGNLFENTEISDESICNSCGKHFLTIHLDRHARFCSKNSVKCKKCGKIFKNSHFLKAHLRMVHNISYHCEVCKKSFAVFKEYQRHTAKSHRKKKSKSVTNADQSGQKTTSSKSTSDKTLKNSKSLRKHTCNMCWMSFNTRKDVQKHRKSAHDDRKMSVCAHCNEALPSKNALRTHMFFHQCFTCPYCSENFPYKAELQRHARSKHRANAKQLKTKLL